MTKFQGLAYIIWKKKKISQLSLINPMISWPDQEPLFAEEVSNKHRVSWVLGTLQPTSSVDGLYKWHQYYQKVTFHKENVITYLVNYPNILHVSVIARKSFTHFTAQSPLKKVKFKESSSYQHFLSSKKKSFSKLSHLWKVGNLIHEHTPIII